MNVLERLRLHDPLYIEIFSGLTAVAWGTYSVFDGASLESLPFYDPLARYLPDYLWNTWAIAGGVAQVTVALAHWRAPRAVMALVQMVLYKFIAVSIILSDHPSPGSMVYCGWAFGNVASFLRLLVP